MSAANYFKHAVCHRAAQWQVTALPDCCSLDSAVTRVDCKTSVAALLQLSCPCKVFSLAMQMLQVQPRWLSLNPHVRLKTGTVELLHRLHAVQSHHQPVNSCPCSCTVLSRENTLRLDSKLYKMEMPSFLLVHGWVLVVVVLMVVVLGVVVLMVVVLGVVLMALVVAMLHLHGMSMLHLAILRNRYSELTERLAHSRQHNLLQRPLMSTTCK